MFLTGSLRGMYCESSVLFEGTYIKQHHPHEREECREGQAHRECGCLEVTLTLFSRQLDYGRISFLHVSKGVALKYLYTVVKETCRSGGT